MDSYDDEDVTGAGGLSAEPSAGRAPEPRSGQATDPLAGPRQEPAACAVPAPHSAPDAEFLPESGQEAGPPPAHRSGPGTQPGRKPGAARDPVQEHEPAPEPTPEAVHPRGHQPHPELPPAPPAPPVARGIAGLSLPYQVAAVVFLAGVAVLACVHLTMVFLHVAPSNTVTKKHGEAVDSWVYPEFEQNWKLFAPNPLQQNVGVQVKAEYTTAEGDRDATDWIDLTAQDSEAIRGNLLPSHVQQNELRRAWDLYISSHDNENRPNGLRGQLSETYVRRIVMTRLEGRDLGGPVERIQLRSATRSVKAPEWSDENIDTRPSYRVLPWWTVTAADLSGGVHNGQTEGDR
ncbi:DUF5819 family protein [Streptomyces sp. NBC_00829]|uniref:DUF5819 family protein n=1 Tax=Streptomyces sp. NBC_00829 TaxID=2903679 RepID=UPI003863F656|nr:DUF5819 family protein [Streptomyces sp. NBC_00829]